MQTHKKYPYAYELAAALAKQQLDPVELFEETLVNAKASESIFISLTEEKGRWEALLASQRLRQGKPASMLDGVPIAWKDNIDIKGYRTTNGTNNRYFEVPQQDAQIVIEASSMGLLSTGKTNLSELAYSGLGINASFGTPLQVDAQHEPLVPGGSSSGSAVAVREGIVSVAVGTDTAGSIRVPAAFNGLVGYKTSTSTHCQTGITPLARSLDSVGTIAQCVTDCILVNNCLKGVSPSLPSPKKTSEITLVVDENILSSIELEEAVQKNFDKTLYTLKNAGISVIYKTLTSVEQARSLIATHQWLGSMEAYLEFGHLLQDPNTLNLDKRISSRLKSADSKTLAQLAKIRDLQHKLMSRVSYELSNAVLILPTVRHCAPYLKSLEKDDELYASTNLSTLEITMLASFLNMPTFALPNGKDALGRYTSFQLSQPYNCDFELERTALTIESLTLNLT